MTRLRCLIAVVAIVALATPASADHGSPTYIWAQRAVVIEDRTGNIGVQDAIANAVTRWNLAGANVSLTWRAGAATNSCGPQGNVVSVCHRALSNGYSGQTPLGYQNGVIDQAFIEVETQYVEKRPDLLKGIVSHEVGHAICCLAHSAEHSVMNPSWSVLGCGYDCDGPSAHDLELIRSVYGPTTPVPTGVRLLTAVSGQVAAPPATTSAAAVTMQTRNGTTNQQWTVTVVEGGYRLRNGYSSQILSAMGDRPGSVVAQWPMTRMGAYQVWAIEPSGEGHRLRNISAGMCAEAGSPVVVNPCSGGATQTWRLAS